MNLEQATQILCSIFRNAEELRRFLSEDRQLKVIVDSLPDESSSLRWQIEATLKLLIQRHLLAVFRDRLLSHRYLSKRLPPHLRLDGAVLRGIEFSPHGPQHERPQPPPDLAPKPESAQPPPVEFQFRLEGPQASHDAVVKRGAADLVFFLGSADVASLAGIDLAARHAEALQRLLKAGGSLSVMVVPVGYSLREGPCQKFVDVQPGARTLEVRFPLSAAAVADTDAGTWVYLAVDNVRIGAFFLSIPIVDDAAQAQQKPHKKFMVDLDRVGQPLDAELYIQQKRDVTKFVLSIREKDDPKKRSVRRGTFSHINRESLKTALDGLSGLMSEVAECPLWGSIPDPFNFTLTDDQRGLLHEQRLKMAAVGWRLWADLQKDPEMKDVLDQIDRLPTGSRISIITDYVFVPWEILYPENPKLVPDIKPGLFWGARYIISSTMFEDDWKPGQEWRAHAAGNPAAALCVDLGLDRAFSALKPPPAASHADWAAGQVAKHIAARIVDPADAWDLLMTGKKTEKWIYVFCHSRAAEGGRAEALLLDASEKLAIEVLDLSETSRFEGRPVVFLNSCSSGAPNPLSLHNFYEAFRSVKGALGIVGTSFPVPTVTAAAIGQQISGRYLDGSHDLGSALFEVRSELLDRGIPIGLFYTLHAPGDARAVSTNPGEADDAQ